MLQLVGADGGEAAGVGVNGQKEGALQLAVVWSGKPIGAVAAEISDIFPS